MPDGWLTPLTVKLPAVPLAPGSGAKEMLWLDDQFVQ